MAVAYKRLQIVKLLLEHNAKLSVDLEGYTPLHLALFVARSDEPTLNKVLALLLPHCDADCLQQKTLKGQQQTAQELARSFNLESQFEKAQRLQRKTEL